MFLVNTGLIPPTRTKVTEMKVRKENGLTLIGFLIALAVAMFFAYAGMRIVPMYLVYAKFGITAVALLLARRWLLVALVVVVVGAAGGV